MSRTENESSSLATPGPLGRGIRLVLGLGILSLLYSLLTEWQSPLWSGEVPNDVAFYVLIGLALYATSWVVRLPLNKPWGQAPLLLVLLGAGITAAAGYAAESIFPLNALGLYVWTWFVLFTALLGSAHVLAAALATPGCEMRSYAHLRARLGGRNAEIVVCPGGIDRFDHVGVSPGAHEPKTGHEGGSR